MTGKPQLYIATDDPERAALQVFGLPLLQLPGWAAVVSDWREIARLPAGAPVVAIWFPKGSGRNAVSLAEQTWRERREAVRLDDDFGRHMGRVDDWLARRAAAEQLLLADGDDASLPTESSPVPEAAPMRASRNRWS